MLPGNTLKEAKSMSSYQLVCDMEMTQNDELKSYEVKVDYLKITKAFLRLYYLKK